MASVNNKVSDLIEDKNGVIWFTLYYTGPASTYKFQNNKLIRMPLGHGFSLYEGRSGSLWLGTDGSGAVKYNLQILDHPETQGKDADIGLKVHYSVKGHSSFNRIYCIHEDKSGNMWFGSYAGGVNLYDGKTTRNISKKDGFTGKAVIVILEDEQGYLWFGTEGDGILKCRFQDHKIDIVDSFTTEDGLSNNVINSLLFDDKGNLWAGTNNKLNKLFIKQLNRTGKKIIKQYGEEEGFIGIECTPNACKDKSGNLWFGTVEGAMKYNPKADKTNQVEPKTHVSNIKLFFENVDLHSYCDSFNLLGMPVNLALPYTQNHLTFEFIGICLTSPVKVNYQWKLEGFDKNWSPISKKHEVTYSNLSPGEYTFKVKSSNNDGFWNKEPTTFTFTITPPYWETGWFYTVELLFFMTLIGGTLIASRKGAGTRTITILVYICLFVIFEFVQNLCEPFYEEYVGSAPIIKTLLNLVLASTLLPVQLYLRKYLRGKQKKQRGEEDELV